MVAELKVSGLVFEVDGKASGQRGGRPGVQLVLQDSTRAVVGIDFGHSHVQVAVADLAHNVLAERRRELDVDHRSADALDASARMIEEVLGEAGVRRAAVIWAGIGLPCSVDRARGKGGSADMLPSWRGPRIGTRM